MARVGGIAWPSCETLQRRNGRPERVEGQVSGAKARAMALVDAEVARHGVRFAALGAGVDRFEERLRRLERRLDPTDA